VIWFGKPGTTTTWPGHQRLDAFGGDVGGIGDELPGQLADEPAWMSVAMSVSVMPGQSAVTVTPLPFSSSDIASVKASTYAFVAA
jgi:hypothetical protein